jgi:hypothetical protein
VNHNSEFVHHRRLSHGESHDHPRQCIPICGRQRAFSKLDATTIGLYKLMPQ